MIKHEENFTCPFNGFLFESMIVLFNEKKTQNWKDVDFVLKVNSAYTQTTRWWTSLEWNNTESKNIIQMNQHLNVSIPINICCICSNQTNDEYFGWLATGPRCHLRLLSRGGSDGPKWWGAWTQRFAHKVRVCCVLWSRLGSLQSCSSCLAARDVTSSRNAASRPQDPPRSSIGRRPPAKKTTTTSMNGKGPRLQGEPVSKRDAVVSDRARRETPRPARKVSAAPRRINKYIERTKIDGTK